MYPTTLLMIRPVAFGYNEQTAESNAFQIKDTAQQDAQEQALKEFDRFVKILRDNGINVLVIEDTVTPHTPDSIFPNNWISFHETGDIFLYPMQAENRRLERREDVISTLEDTFKVRHVIDLSRFEKQGKYLEGTGSMVFDRENKVAYACLSPRTDQDVLDRFCEESFYTAVTFHAADQNGQAIYHTNVMMCIASKYAVICLDSIADNMERLTVISSLEMSGKSIVNISYDQMNHFAGNMLEVFNAQGESLLVMSGSAHASLDEKQISTLEKYSRIIHSDIPVIERNGGGSVRCMMAEVALSPLVR
ncbi:hypothetical protein C8P68_10840 [Mucilaginibacter yixingensis]|uniref:Amidinotransferase n=1 Tax=Mucilaginibacter yixingensis TaxID=1295612 RepID=A0A2T5J5N4_9SPHI|nr:arginine deiminase-related protein [Mucilaginibacter yixingensis]PTQ93578.1 hypothetical protein C8P68_10840 [Mucilaginibacter yixingensis]